MSKHLVGLSLVLALIGCNEPEKAPPPPEPVKEAPVVVEKPQPKSKPKPKLSPAEPRTKLGPYPVAVDLEREADKTVVADNFERELKRIEKELDTP